LYLSTPTAKEAPTRGVNRDSGPASSNGGQFRRRLASTITSHMLNLSVITCKKRRVPTARFVAGLQVLPCEAQRIPAALELAIAVVLLCLLCVLQSNGKPVVACLVSIACEFVLDALNKFG
jgi:hypothetical protein